MEHYMEQAQAWGACLTDTSVLREAQLPSTQPGVALLRSEPNGSQLDHAGASREVPGGRKRRGCKPTQTPEEKRMKKNEADRNSRKKHKAQFDQLKAIASRFGGVEEMERRINEMEAEWLRPRRIVQEFHMIQPMGTEFQRFEQMKDKFGGIEEMEFKLERFEEIKSIFGWIDEMVTEINRPKNVELQHIESQQMESRLNHQNAQQIIGFLQELGYHGMQSVNFNNQVQGSEINWLEDYETSEMYLAVEWTNA